MQSHRKYCCRCFQSDVEKFPYYYAVFLRFYGEFYRHVLTRNEVQYGLTEHLHHTTDSLLVTD
jgi:hypothetical protein